ncbi:glycosyltransferase family 4 protein [Stenotrophomonas sp. GD03993]|uniref:glycosyltransferase family 4 protein n=1 Tax=unclassified Stenotrophomonas TaxID=196198 RepID=UPI001313718B|nr:MULTISPECIES: glycosyltransferase family 4 protein [Stenotrophomonas]MBH1461099.1 glycosyltransferase family 4 protein [Stenotrophomonas maltophilia]MDH0189389.1 glycosyltransferase family 4 protein [Stenotrophomonas sp. GD04051]MDH0464511.1 glycosyltransferase family 4 protein [Stenotrophomonas sp. GD03993]MDH0877017.1 glycosyltransferase family 4 protein [Stenotrophomonas sp. GD03877]MDH2156537.1 glycosyltransferase family 4 protein [Stenotrophomonas sp. GD03657]
MKVSVIYHQFPHYRAPVLRELSLNGRHEYEFHASKDEFDGIKPYKGEPGVVINELAVKRTDRGFSFKNYIRLATDSSVDVLLILGNPNIIATWALGIVGRATGKKVVFWAHGWLSQERKAKALIRNFYYSISHLLLVYGERSREMGIRQGYPESKIRTIYNSLDFAASSLILERIERDVSRAAGRALFENPDRPLIICTARLTQICRLDLLLDAGELLGKRGLPVNILLIGDGPARKSLEAQAARIGASVHFFGACYDEEMVGRMIYDADACVSPGKIGLTAIHSLTYGTPAFTHGDFSNQMPEFEAIEPGRTGNFFERGSSESLADCLEAWMEQKPDRAEVRNRCRDVISRRWNPSVQRTLIEDALDEISKERRM